MGKKIGCCAFLAALLATTALSAQEVNRSNAQQQSFPAQQQPAGQTNAPLGTNPGTLDGQPQAPLANQASPADVGPAQANTANTGDSSGWPIGSTQQTAPSTVSARNAELDKLPTGSLQLPLSDAQKKLIVESMSQLPNSPDAERVGKVGLGNFVSNSPANVRSSDFSSDLKTQIPAARHYKFVKGEKQVFIIDPINEVVVGIIPL
jgi:hypothetical protein